MYETTSESGRQLLCSRGACGGEYLFSLAHTRLVIDRLLTKKQRNNGVGRALGFELRKYPQVTHLLAGYGPQDLGFSCSKIPFEQAWGIELLGKRPDLLVRRLNRSRVGELALSATRHEREVRRRLRAQGICMAKPRAPRAIAGENGALVRHFKNTRMTLAEAVDAIAFSTGTDRTQILDAFRDSLKDRGAAVFRVGKSFAFRVKFDRVPLSAELLDLSGAVSLWSTKDNAHSVYRRLRKRLRYVLDCESRKRKRAREIHAETQRWRRMNRAWFA